MASNIVLKLNNKKNNPRNSEGSFVTLADGKIMYAYSRYYGKSWSDAATATISARYSVDDGITWSKKDKLIVANEGSRNVMSVSLLRLQDSRIAMVYLRKNGDFDCRPYMRTSTDEGKTWSKPTLCISPKGYFVVNNDRVIQLKGGRIVIPASFHRPRPGWTDPTTATHDSRSIAFFYYSDDNGKTWFESDDWWALPVRSQSGLQETGAVELKDGRLYGWCRTDTGRQWEMTSRNKGGRWTQPKPSRFKSPRSPMSIKRIPTTGDLLAVWNDHSNRWDLPEPKMTGKLPSWGRTPLVLATSSDEGRTWRNAKLIETDPKKGYCYIAIHPLDDAVLLAYCCGGGRSGVLQDSCIRRITLDWIYG